MFTFLACQTHSGKIGANIIKSLGGWGVLERVGGEPGRGGGSEYTILHQCCENASEPGGGPAAGSQRAKALQSLPAPCSVALKFLCLHNSRACKPRNAPGLQNNKYTHLKPLLSYGAYLPRPRFQQLNFWWYLTSLQMNYFFSFKLLPRKLPLPFGGGRGRTGGGVGVGILFL